MARHLVPAGERHDTRANVGMLPEGDLFWQQGPSCTCDWKFERDADGEWTVIHAPKKGAKS